MYPLILIDTNRDEDFQTLEDAIHETAVCLRTASKDIGLFTDFY